MFKIHLAKLSVLPTIDEDTSTDDFFQVSPIQQDVKVRYSTVKFEGSFSHPNSSAFRLPPGKEVDDAWSALGIQSV